MIPLKKLEMQGAKFSKNETYLSYVAVIGKLKQRRRLGFFSGIMRYFKTGCIALLLAFISARSACADIGIIVALNSNLEQLREDLKTKEITKKAGREFYSGKIDDRDVVLVRSPLTSYSKDTLLPMGSVICVIL